MANLTPADFVLLPFIPLALVSKPSVRLNDILQKIQYFILLTIYYGLFSLGCLLMAPIAYLKAILTKVYILNTKSTSNRALAVNLLELLFYLVFGLIIQGLNFFTDSIYFWIFNLDEKLETNEVIKDDSKMVWESFHDIIYLCNRFLAEKINSIDVDQMVRIFRNKMHINANVQYLVFD